MTNGWSFFKALSRPRFIWMNWIVGGEVLGIALSLLWTAIQGDFHSYSPFFTFCGFMMIPMVIALVLLATANERTVTSSTYRLIPISDWKFYLLNVGASLVNQVYLWLVQVVFFFLTLWIGHSELDQLFDGFGAGLQALNAEVNLVQFGLSGLVLGILFLLLVWSTISLVHYVTNAANSFLPRFRQGFINAVVYVVVALIAIRVASWLIGTVSYLSSQMINGGMIDSMWTGALVMGIIVVVESAINIFVLQKWVEPKAD